MSYKDTVGKSCSGVASRVARGGWEMLAPGAGVARARAHADGNYRRRDTLTPHRYSIKGIAVNVAMTIVFVTPVILCTAGFETWDWLWKVNAAALVGTVALPPWGWKKPHPRVARAQSYVCLRSHTHPRAGTRTSRTSGRDDREAGAERERGRGSGAAVAPGAPSPPGALH